MSGNIEEYVRQYHGTIYRSAYSYVKNAADADDICQEAFLRLLCFEGEFPSGEDCKRWLLRVTSNLCKNLLKSVRYSKTDELCENIPFEDEQESELFALIKSLPPEYSSVIHLYYYEGYSAKEIAEILKISVTAVTSRLSRGRKKLKKLLTEEEK